MVANDSVFNRLAMEPLPQAIVGRVRKDGKPDRRYTNSLLYLQELRDDVSGSNHAPRLAKFIAERDDNIIPVQHKVVGLSWLDLVGFVALAIGGTMVLTQVLPQLLKGIQ